MMKSLTTPFRLKFDFITSSLSSLSPSSHFSSSSFKSFPLLNSSSLSNKLPIYSVSNSFTFKSSPSSNFSFFSTNVSPQSSSSSSSSDEPPISHSLHKYYSTDPSGGFGLIPLPLWPPTPIPYPPPPAKIPSWKWPTIPGSKFNTPLPCIPAPVPPPSPAAFEPAQYNRVVKKQTGFTGLDVVPNGDDVLIGLLAETLNLLTDWDDIPTNRHFWYTAAYKLKLALSSCDIQDLEQKINEGQVEELIREAEDELDLCIVLNHYPTLNGPGGVSFKPDSWWGQEPIEGQIPEYDYYHPVEEIDARYRSFDELIAQYDPFTSSIDYWFQFSGFKGRKFSELMSEQRKHWFQPGPLSQEDRKRFLEQVEEQIVYRSNPEYKAELQKHKKNLQYCTPQFIEFLHTENIKPQEVDQLYHKIQESKKVFKCEPPFVLDSPQTKQEKELANEWKDWANIYVQSSHRPLCTEEIVMCAEVLVKELKRINNPEHFIELKTQLWILGGIDKKAMAENPSLGTVPNPKLVHVRGTAFDPYDYRPRYPVAKKMAPKPLDIQIKDKQWEDFQRIAQRGNVQQIQDGNNLIDNNHQNTKHIK